MSSVFAQTASHAINFVVNQEPPQDSSYDVDGTHASGGDSSDWRPWWEITEEYDGGDIAWEKTIEFFSKTDTRRVFDLTY